jgi:hypothetical protein
MDTLDQLRVQGISCHLEEHHPFPRSEQRAKRDTKIPENQRSIILSFLSYFLSFSFLGANQQTRRIKYSHIIVARVTYVQYIRL